MSRPLPPEVYRRRRVVVGAGFLGVLVLVWVLVMAVLGDDSDPEPAPEDSATPTATATPDEEVDDGTVPAALTQGETACDPTSVRISPRVAADQSAGAPVSVELAVSSTQETPCVLEASAAQLVVVIDNGQDPVYDSTTCNVSLLTAPISLSPQWATAATISWNGRVSGSTCAESEAFVPGGTYTIKLGTLGGEPGQASFALTEAPEPEPEADSEPGPEPEAEPEAVPAA